MGPPFSPATRLSPFPLASCSAFTYVCRDERCPPFNGIPVFFVVVSSLAFPPSYTVALCVVFGSLFAPLFWNFPVWHSRFWPTGLVFGRVFPCRRARVPFTLSPPLLAGFVCSTRLVTQIRKKGYRFCPPPHLHKPGAPPVVFHLISVSWY